MKCLLCAHLDLKEHPAHAKAGMGKCKGFKDLTGAFVTIGRDRECERFVAADAEIAAKRVEWYKKAQTGAQ